jgi:limonene-1,2-epoxide hydrolase
VTAFARAELDEAFQHFFRLGCVEEDWLGWADLFTDDAVYIEHFWGEMHGREEVRAWIEPVMSGVPEIYTVLEWYAIDDDVVVWRMQNRRDNPDAGGPPYFDFAGLSVARYAGDGRWSYEEDYWDVPGARRTADAYAEACRKTGADLQTKLSRRFWPDEPEWARFNGTPSPSWLGRDDIQSITKPRELRALLAPLREGT